MPNPWVSLRQDKLIPVNKAVNEKRKIGKRVGGGGEKNAIEKCGHNNNVQKPSNKIQMTPLSS
jgi:hypothetical protein